MQNLKMSWLLSGIIFSLLLIISGCGSPSSTPPTPKSDANAHLVKGFDYYNAGQFDEARDEFAKAIELNPDFVEAYLGTGHAEQALEHWKNAVTAYDKAIELDPNLSAAIYVSRGSSYLGLEEWEKAIVDLDRAIELESKTLSDQAVLIMAYKGRAYANVSLGNNEQAHQDFETVLTLDPNDSEASDIEKMLELLKPQPVLSTPKESLAPCNWFVESQFLRAARISGLTKFTTLYQKYGAEGFTSDDLSTLEELDAAIVEAFEEYLPYEREFVEKWQQLGSTPGAEDFWEKELEAEKQKLAAMEKVIDGIKTMDDTLRLEGINEWEQAVFIGREAEAAMIEVRDKCVDETN